MNKYLLLTIGLGLAFLLGIVSYASYRNSQDRQTSKQEATVLLERIRSVCKLVTVEGDVSELYNETMTKNVTLYLPLPTNFSFDKQATVQVTGTVLVGYNLEKVSFDLDVDRQTLTISNLPEPEILAIDHELSYRDLSESWFNSFKPADYTALNNNAKEMLRQKVTESDLLLEAKAQGLGVIESIQLLMEAAGYEVITTNAETAAAVEG